MCSREFCRLHITAVRTDVTQNVNLNQDTSEDESSLMKLLAEGALCDLWV